MTIPKEERTEWRERLNAHYSDPCREVTEMRDFSLRLLDALETGERITAGYKIMLECAEDREEIAEQQRDILIKLLTLEEVCPAFLDVFIHGADCDECELEDRKRIQNCWLEWTRQQAQGGENE